MTRDEILALQEKAKQATPGPWTVDVETEGDQPEDGLSIVIPEISRSLHDHDWADSLDWQRDLSNATFIAAANPAAVIALCELALAPLTREEAAHRERIMVLGQALRDCLKALSLPSAEHLTHKTVLVDYDPAGSTYETAPHQWFADARAALFHSEPQAQPLGSVPLIRLRDGDYDGPILPGMTFVWTPTGVRLTVSRVGTYNGYLRVWCLDPRDGREVMNDEHRWREACVPTSEPQP